MNKEETLCYTNVYLLFSFFGVASLAKEEAFIGTRLADSGPCGHCWVRVYLDSKFLATAQTHFLQRRWGTTDTCFNTPVLAWKMCLLRFQAHTHTQSGNAAFIRRVLSFLFLCYWYEPRIDGSIRPLLKSDKRGKQVFDDNFLLTGIWGCRVGVWMEAFNIKA